MSCIIHFEIVLLKLIKQALLTFMYLNDNIFVIYGSDTMNKISRLFKVPSDFYPLFFY